MVSHDPTGPLLIIHSIVVAEPHRHKGIGSALMKNYLSYVSKLDLKYTIEKLVLIAKKEQLTFYVKEGGFRVMRQSNVMRMSSDTWFECEREVGENINGPSLKKERKSECWIVDSFAVLGKNNGVGMMGMKGTGNPAAVVLVPAMIMEKLGGDVAVVGAGGDGNGGIIPTTSTGSSAGVGGATGGEVFFSQKSERNNSISSRAINPNDNSFLQDPDHEATVSWMKMVAQEFNLSETAFIWEHAQSKKDLGIQNNPTDQTTTQATQDNNEVGQYSPLEKQQNTLSDPPEQESSPHYTIRFYTCDGSSVNLCGHATLAASTVVFKNLSMRGVRLADMSVVFHANNGLELGAKPALSKQAAGLTGSKTMKITMEFPWKELKLYTRDSGEWDDVMTMLRDAFFSVQPAKSLNQSNDDVTKDDKLELLDEDVLFMGVDKGGDDLLVELNHVAFSKIPKHLADINFRSMKELGGYARGVILCCAVDEFSRRRQEEQSLSHPSARVSNTRSTSDTKNGKMKGGGGSATVDFLSRFFGPKVGIEEDPVTGSAHCILGPYFSSKLGRKTVVGKQMSHRGGIIECTPHETSESEIASENKKTVIISGSAVMVMSGMLYI